MAGLPNFATYFGRDMMMTALMMRPIWTAGNVGARDRQRAAEAGPRRRREPRGGARRPGDPGERRGVRLAGHRVLPRGASRTAARGRQPAGAGARRARRAAEDPRELPHDRRRVPAAGAGGAISRPIRPFRRTEARLPARQLRWTTAPGWRSCCASWRWWRPGPAPTPKTLGPTNLVSFPKRDATHWRSASWRDSDAGYAGGRFAMDVNAIWAPQALEAIGLILAALAEDWDRPSHCSGIAAPLAIPDPASLGRAIETWKGARRHFEVTLSPAEVQKRVTAKLAWLPPAERRYWQKITTAERQPRDSLSFLALSLDAAGKPIPVVNTDPATGLFLGSTRRAEDRAARRRALHPSLSGRPPRRSLGRWWRTTRMPRVRSGSASGPTSTTGPGSSGDAR